MIDPKSILMQGDLVYNHRNWICPVVGIDKDTITVIAQHYGESTYKKDEIYPIPLTEEIILKLGWEEIDRDHPDYKSRIGLGKQFKHPWYTSCLCIRHNNLTDKYWVLNGNMVLRYLHDLQHILHHTTEDEIRYDYEINKLSIKHQTDTSTKPSTIH